MNSLVFGTLTFIVVLPAISICDEDLSKTSANNPESSEQTVNSFDDSVTKYPYLQNIYNDEESDYINEINDPWSFYRQLRAPSGFSAVRGKKKYEPEVYWELDEDDEILSSQPKRAPSQAFFGMRGKKYYDNKRGPSGFLGVRGKKNNRDDQSSDDLQAELYRDLQNEREKIAGLVRGYIKEKEKRKPSGFVGLRGKKSVNNDDYYEAEKRAPMGFQGVRGKKSEYPNFIGSEEKRVPVSGFFGMRGKKQPTFSYQSSNFFGVRKKPYMPYGKFVGVRGKKAQDGTVKRLLLSSDDLDQVKGLRPAARVAADTSQDKRIGFIGMRG